MQCKAVQLLRLAFHPSMLTCRINALTFSFKLFTISHLLPYWCAFFSNGRCELQMSVHDGHSQPRRACDDALGPPAEERPHLWLGAGGLIVLYICVIVAVINSLPLPHE